MELVAEITHWVPTMKLLSLALAAIFVAFGIAKFAQAMNRTLSRRWSRGIRSCGLARN